MRKYILHLLVFVAGLHAVAAPVDEGKQLYAEGRYEEALEILRPLAARSPRDGNINYWYGATLAALGRGAEAKAPLTSALDRRVSAAALRLAEIATADYDPEAAREYYDRYEALMRRNRKEVPEDIDDKLSRLIIMENMLSRVEKIEVIDSLVVDADGFFSHYRLSPEAGRLVPGEMVHLPDAEVAFVPQNNSEILYSEADSLGNFVLMGADILDDGSVDHPAPLEGENLAGGGNAEYPFLMSDGLTLYFANDGEGSLGGYDIFLTRRSDDGFLQPQNIGMPYNSPYDDYLLAIDETTGAGWWATDRNRIPGKLTIYIFVPSETRVNVPEDNPDLKSLAMLSDISLTREDGKDYAALLERVKNAGASGAVRRGNAGAPAFELPMGSASVIYTSLSDFRSPSARDAMARAINVKAEIASIESRLDGLREKYRNGYKDTGADIINLEHRLEDARGELADYINRAIKDETSNRN